MRCGQGWRWRRGLNCGAINGLNHLRHPNRVAKISDWLCPTKVPVDVGGGVLWKPPPQCCKSPGCRCRQLWHMLAAPVTSGGSTLQLLCCVTQIVQLYVYIHHYKQFKGVFEHWWTFKITLIFAQIILMKKGRGKWEISVIRLGGISNYAIRGDTPGFIGI